MFRLRAGRVRARRQSGARARTHAHRHGTRARPAGRPRWASGAARSCRAPALPGAASVSCPVRLPAARVQGAARSHTDTATPLGRLAEGASRQRVRTERDRFGRLRAEPARALSIQCGGRALCRAASRKAEARPVAEQRRVSDPVAGRARVSVRHAGGPGGASCSNAPACATGLLWPWLRVVVASRPLVWIRKWLAKPAQSRSRRAPPTKLSPSALMEAGDGTATAKNLNSGGCGNNKAKSDGFHSHLNKVNPQLSLRCHSCKNPLILSASTSSFYSCSFGIVSGHPLCTVRHNGSFFYYPSARYALRLRPC